MSVREDGQSGFGRRVRRLISRSTASRMKSERFSLSAKSASIRASVPSGKRAGVCSSLIFVRPTGRFVPDITNSGKSCILLISPIDETARFNLYR